MDNAQLFQLQQLLDQEDLQKKKRITSQDSSKIVADSKSLPSFLKTFQSLNASFYSQYLQQISHQSIAYEQNIDPIWYLLNGPMIIYPYSSIPHLNLDDFVEYFKKFPQFHWSKYPLLYNAMIEKISAQQQHSWLSLDTSLQLFSQFRASMQKSIDYISEKLFFDNSNTAANNNSVWKWLQYLIFFYFVSKFISKIYKI